MKVKDDDQAHRRVAYLRPREALHVLASLIYFCQLENIICIFVHCYVYLHRYTTRTSSSLAQAPKNGTERSMRRVVHGRDQS